MVSNAVAVDYALDLPSQLRWTGVTMDAALRVAEPLARGDDVAAARDWMRLSALQGSMLEHRLFESQFLVDSISADKGLGLARQSGVDVILLDQGEGDPRLELLDHPAAVEEDVGNWLRLGMVVEVPVAPIALNAWTGSVWRVEDPATGAGGYLIAGGLAGGATTEPPGDWGDFPRDDLEGPSSPPANPDPLAGVEMFKVGSADGWTGEVGTILPVNLAAKVVDVNGWPGGSRASGEPPRRRHPGRRGGRRVLRPDRHDQLPGIARARFRLGKYTSVEPFYRRQPGDEFSTQVLMHWWRRSRPRPGTAGDRRAVPAVRDARRAVAAGTDTTETELDHCRAGTWVDTITVAAEDQYGNPVSNVHVRFWPESRPVMKDVTIRPGISSKPSCSRPRRRAWVT